MALLDNIFATGVYRRLLHGGRDYQKRKRSGRNTGLGNLLAITNASTVATPTLSLTSGTYNGAQVLTIACANQGASIYYTLNGADLDDATGMLYEGPITLPLGDHTVKAVGRSLGKYQSATVTATYSIITMEQVETPSISPESGEAGTDELSVTITCGTAGASIYYSLDGGAWTAYSGAFSPGFDVGTHTVGAYAEKAYYTDSAESAVTYDVVRYVYCLHLYAEHEEEFDDPVLGIGGQDRAQLEYERLGQYNGITVDEWVDSNFSLPESNTYPSFEILSRLNLGANCVLKVIHVGLDEEGVLHPYTVPATHHPYGYYVCKYGLNGYPENDNGWTTYNGALTDGLGRQVVLATEILESGDEYINQYINHDLIYDKLVEGKIDMVILSPPLCLNYNAHNSYGQYAYDSYPCSYKSVNVTIGTRTSTNYFMSVLGWPNNIFTKNTTVVTLHEYMHSMYRPPNISGTDYPYLTGNLLGGDTKISKTIPDTYLTTPPYPPLAGQKPMLWAIHSAYFNGILTPPLAASLGYTSLDRIVTVGGTYTIKNEVDTHDYLVLPSPIDQTCYCILHAFYPKSLGGNTDYPQSNETYRGVYATVLKLKDWDNITGDLETSITHTPYETYSNTYNPIGCYMIDSMTYRHNYSDIAQQATIPLYTGGNVTARKLLLIEHDNPLYPHGVGVTPFGASIEWEGNGDDGWSEDENGVKQATVRIYFYR